MHHKFQFYFFWLLQFTFCSHLFAQTVIDGVQLETLKKDGNRQIKAMKSIELSLNIVESLKLVLNFEEKCNNSFKDKRKWSDKNYHCKFHNSNLIETIYFREIKNKKTDLKDHFLLLRHGYNRGDFLYFEEISVEQNEQEAHVQQRLLSDAEVKTFIETQYETNFSFQNVNSKFHLIKLSNERTKLTYSYEGSTDHWLLNKEMMVGTIFESTAKSINDLFLTFSEGMNAP